MYNFFSEVYLLPNFKEPTQINNGEHTTWMMFPVLILIGLNESYKKRKKTIKEELMGDYGLTIEKYELLKKMTTNKVFYGGEWGEFQKIYSNEIGTYIPHYSMNINNDCTIAFCKNFDKNEVYCQIYNNNKKINFQTESIKLDKSETIEMLYNSTKTYFIENT
jgi:hypothetical protein